MKNVIITIIPIEINLHGLAHQKFCMNNLIYCLLANFSFSMMRKEQMHMNNLYFTYRHIKIFPKLEVRMVIEHSRDDRMLGGRISRSTRSQDGHRA